MVVLAGVRAAGCTDVDGRRSLTAATIPSVRSPCGPREGVEDPTVIWLPSIGLTGLSFLFASRRSHLFANQLAETDERVYERARRHSSVRTHCFSVGTSAVVDWNVNRELKVNARKRQCPALTIRRLHAIYGEHLLHERRSGQVPLQHVRRGARDRFHAVRRRGHRRWQFRTR